MMTEFAERQPEFLQLLPAINRLLNSPSSERASEIVRFWVVVKEQGFDKDSIFEIIPLAVVQALGEYQVIAEKIWGNVPMFWMWEPGLREFRQSDAFKNKVRSSGLLAYWHKRGWPDLCRPVDDDDFVCD